MRKLIFALLLAAAAAGSTHAQTLNAGLKPLGFLVGRWAGGGDVHDTGGAGKGVSVITVEANGGVLLRKDHTELYDKAGKPTGGFDQVMMIYPDAGGAPTGVRAEYSDGEHLIHYGSATVVEGKSVEFVSAAPPGAPVFHLRYDVTGPDGLKVTFGLVPPGSTTFQPIATGALHRVK